MTVRNKISAFLESPPVAKVVGAAKSAAVPEVARALGIVPRTIATSVSFGLGAFAAGIAVGAGGALLLAPAKGEEMRRMARDYLQARIDQARRTASSVVESAQETAEAIASQGEAPVDRPPPDAERDVAHA